MKVKVNGLFRCNYAGGESFRPRFDAMKIITNRKLTQIEWFCLKSAIYAQGRYEAFAFAHDNPSKAKISKELKSHLTLFEQDDDVKTLNSTPRFYQEGYVAALQEVLEKIELTNAN